MTVVFLKKISSKVKLTLRFCPMLHVLTLVEGVVAYLKLFQLYKVPDF